MKACLFCGEQISDAAKKCFHCQSFQDPKDAPRAGLDVAQLVISFIGTIALVGTVLAALFAYFGYRTLDRVVTEATELKQSTLGVLSKAETTIGTFSNEIAEAQKRTRNLEIELYTMLVRQKFDHFQTLMDSLVLGRLWDTTDFLDELREVSRSVQSSGLVSNTDLSQGVIDKRTEIKAIVEAVDAYQLENYQSTIDVLKSVSNKSLNKHRLLGAAYDKFYVQARKENSHGDIAKYQTLILEHTRQYEKLASRANKTTIIAKNNLAIALMRRNNPGDLKAAYELLSDARREAPNSIPVVYNLAVYYVRIKDFSKAIAELQNCKKNGGFALMQDKQMLQNDEEMRPLFQNNDEAIKAAIRDLLN